MKQKLSSKEVEELFLKFFERKGHNRIQNSSIIPVNDDSLLFINSGMAPLKIYFLGLAEPPYIRLTNSQTCIRTNDLASVGDSHHGTSFHMLGNWSFGDYFKKDALNWALELVLELGFPLDRLYVTVFKNSNNIEGVSDDNESYSVWKELLPADHIKWAPAEDNWWSCGDTGPCGPCSEIFFDRGEEFATGEPETSGLIPGRHVEIWNGGVFMTYNKLDGGALGKLPKKCVDSGAGLERITMLLQDANSIHELKEFQPVFSEILKQTNDILWSRIIFDHLKTSLFLLDAGTQPSNKLQGYVLRRLLRRLFCGYIKGLQLDSVIELAEKLSPIVGVKMNPIIKSLLQGELDKFAKVVSSQSNLKSLVALVNDPIINAEKVFQLFSTKGIPLELIEEKCLSEGKEYPKKEVEELLEEHRSKS
ncbi:MAG: alanine--tRNA ligase-related protein [Candidatus Paceibacterota bacterium]